MDPTFLLTFLWPEKLSQLGGVIFDTLYVSETVLPTPRMLNSPSHAKFCVENSEKCTNHMDPIPQQSDLFLIPPLYAEC